MRFFLLIQYNLREVNKKVQSLNILLGAKSTRLGPMVSAAGG
jgi:hypothetical protein